jgi:hypothetical protein
MALSKEARSVTCSIGWGSTEDLGNAMSSHVTIEKEEN